MVGERKEEKRGGSGKVGGRVRRDQDATMYCLYLFGPLLLKHRRKKRGRERKRSQGERREVKKSKQESNRARKEERKEGEKKEKRKEKKKKLHR